MNREGLCNAGLHVEWGVRRATADCCCREHPRGRGEGPLARPDVLLERVVTTRAPRRQSASSKAASKPRRREYAYDYFISYSSPNLKDAEFVERVLRGRKHRVWVQVYDSRMSENIDRNITEALLKSRHFIALLSSHYTKSQWAMNEIHWFYDQRKDRGADQRHLIILDCEPILPDDEIFKNIYRGALYDKASEADRTAEVIRALKHDAAKVREPLTTPFVNVPDPPNCFGRDQEIACIEHYFFPDGAPDESAAQATPPRDNRRVLIQAGPGFGKTTLAAYFARRNRGYFAGVWWIPSQDPATLLAAVVAIAPPKKAGSPTPELGRRVLSRYFQDTTAPFLLVFDNVGAPSEDAGLADGAIGAGAPRTGTERLVVQLAASLGTNIRVLMTSRRPGWDAGAELIEIKGLGPNAAADFLMRRSGFDDEEGSLRLAADLGGLPLALDHAGAYCARSGRSFDEYRKHLLQLIKRAPPGVEYDTAVFATTTTSLEYARKICPEANAVTRLADFLSYCSADRIPRALCLHALDDDDGLLTDEAIGALRDVGLLNEVEAYHDEAAVGVHRLVQRIIRVETDASGRSNAVVSRLMPFLCEQLAGEPEGASPDKTLRVRKYLPHLFQSLPHLDAPDFRGTQAGDLLDQVAKLVVLSLEKEALAGGADDSIPEHLPRLLGCFYEVDPLAEPLEFLLTRAAGRKQAWEAFRDACLNEGNYVLRFALSTALADAIEKPGSGYSIKEAAALVEKPQTLNHFELGGYTLKSYYSNRVDETPDPRLLRRLAEHPCYPGRSILGDLMLNLVYQGKTPTALLPPAEGENLRFWAPEWDFIAYDVNAIIAAEYINRRGRPSTKDRAKVQEEFDYRQDLDAQRDALLGELKHAPRILKIVDDYYRIGVDLKPMADRDDAFAALRQDRLVTPVLRLFFGHPLWSVAEAAANVIARLYSGACEAEDDGARDDYHGAIVELLAPDLPWRVRFGALEAAFQIRLHETPKMKTFADGVRAFYNDPSSKLRGLCAENLLSVMLNANNEHRLKLEATFEREMRFWLKDEDCWVLEHVHRYFNALARRDKDAFGKTMAGALVADASALCEGLDTWWQADRETFLSHIEERKRTLRGSTSADAESGRRVA